MPAEAATQGLDPPGDTRPRLTLSQAADAARVSHKTVRRALDAGRFPQARREDGPNGPGTGPWGIPVDDLLAAGYRLGRPAPPEDSEGRDTGDPTQGRVTPADPAVLARLEADNAALRQRVAVAEALAAERGRHLDDLRLALHALGPAPTSATPARPRRWWRRNSPPA